MPASSSTTVSKRKPTWPSSPGRTRRAYQANGNIGTQVRHNGVEYQCKLNHTSAPESEPGVGAQWQTYWQVFTVNNAADVLDNFAADYSGWAAQGFEIAGYVWWQGYNDRGEPAATLYRENMARFIQQIRAYYENRYPNKGAANAPFVLATLAADGGWSNTQTVDMKVAQAQLDVAGDVPNVKAIEARGFWRDASESPSAVGYHYNWNAETYLLVGDALGRAMVELQGTATTPDYDTWTGKYPGADLTDPNGDHDEDGMSNDEERIFGLNPTSGASANPVNVALNATAGTFSYTRRDDALTLLDFEIWTSTDLSNWTRDEGAIQSPATPVGEVETVAVTLSPALLAEPKLFVQVRAVK